MKLYLLLILKYIKNLFASVPDEKLDTLVSNYKTLRKRQRKILIKVWKRRIRNIWLFNRKPFLIKSSIYLLIFTTLIYLSYSLYLKDVEVKIITKKEIVVEKEIIDNNHNKRVDFLNQLAYVESRRDYGRCRYTETKNGITYSQFWGRYQIGKSARKEVGYDTVPMHKFLADSLMQEKCMLKLMKRIKVILKDEINEYDGKWIGNYYITESGLIAMAHLVGVGNVKTFINSNGSIIPKDGNRKLSTDYLQQFGRYELNLN